MDLLGARCFSLCFFCWCKRVQRDIRLWSVLWTVSFIIVISILLHILDLFFSTVYAAFKYLCFRFCPWCLNNSGFVRLRGRGIFTPVEYGIDFFFPIRLTELFFVIHCPRCKLFISSIRSDSVLAPLYFKFVILQKDL